MQKGNIMRGFGGPRSWRKCPAFGCGKVIKGQKKAEKHMKEKHN